MNVLNHARKKINSMGLITDIKSNLGKETIYDTIQFLIDDEHEAIDGYEKAKKQLQYFNMPAESYDNAVALFDHIIAEEKEHIEELQALKRGEVVFNKED